MSACSCMQSKCKQPLCFCMCIQQTCTVSSACFEQCCCTSSCCSPPHANPLACTHITTPVESPLLSQSILAEVALCLLSRLGTAGKAVVPVSTSFGGPELLRGACPTLQCSLHMTYLGHRYPVSAAPTAPLFDPPLSLQRHALVAGSSPNASGLHWKHEHMHTHTHTLTHSHSLLTVAPWNEIIPANYLLCLQQ